MIQIEFLFEFNYDSLKVLQNCIFCNSIEIKYFKVGVIHYLVVIHDEESEM